ncbi:MAG: hypothetical protein M3P38_05030 [Chloroflexota bacterium]|nr:hypothetical protein [Chloroflexota bacterium]
MRVLCLCIVAASLVGCGLRLGDLSHSVIYENATDGRVTVYPYGREYPGVKRILAPGASQKDNLPIRDERPETWVATIDAVDESGTFIFCHRYTNGDLAELANRVVVKRGELTC